MYQFQQKSNAVRSRSGRTKSINKNSLDTDTKPPWLRHGSCEYFTRAVDSSLDCVPVDLRRRIDHVLVQDAIATIVRGGVMYERTNFGKVHYDCQRLVRVNLDKMMVVLVRPDSAKYSWGAKLFTKRKKRLFLENVTRITGHFSNKEILFLRGDSPILRLRCPDEQVWATWLRGLIYALSRSNSRKLNNKNSDNNEFVRLFRVYDTDNSGCMSMIELISFFKAAKFNVDVFYVQESFHKYSTDGCGILEANEFEGVLKAVFSSSYLMNVFKNVAQNKTGWSMEDFIRFLENYQYCQNALEEVNDFIAYFEIDQRRPSLCFDGELFTYFGFNLYLFSKMNPVIPESKHSTVWQNMDAPLHDFYINTICDATIKSAAIYSDSAIGINTARPGDTRGVAVLWNLLHRGVRCFHFTVHTDGRHPIIYTTTDCRDNVYAQSIFRFIADNGFGPEMSEWPLILFLDFLDVPHSQIVELGSIIREELFEFLYIPSHGVPMPPVSKLKRKVLIMSRAPEYLDGGFTQRLTRECIRARSVERNPRLADTNTEFQIPKYDFVYNNPQYHKTRHGNGGFIRITVDKKNRVSQSQIKGFHDIVSICVIEHVDSIDPSIDHVHYCIAGSDRRLSRYITNLSSKYKDADKVEHIMKEFTHKILLSSVAYKANVGGTAHLSVTQLLSWGFQMIGSYTSNAGVAPMVLHALFQSNGVCGYVRKEAYYDNSPVRVSMLVICGRQLPQPLCGGFNTGGVKDMANPYVVISAVDGDGTVRRYKSTHRNHNGLNPNWNSEIDVSFVKPALSIIILEVWHSDEAKDERLACNSILLRDVASGIRAVELYDNNTNKLKFAKLLVRFDIKRKNSPVAS